MKTELKFFPTNIEQDIISLFRICNPDIKITSNIPLMLEKILKRSIRKNDSFLSSFKFITYIECSVYCYTCLKDNIPGCNAIKRIYNMNLDTEHLTFHIPTTFTDKDKVMFHSYIEKAISIVDNFKNKPNLETYDLLHILPMSTNINFLLSLSIHDIYIMMSNLINNKKNLVIEYDQVVRSIFEVLCQTQANIFNVTLLEYYKVGKE